MINALNADLPYDRFLALQIAADLLQNQGATPEDLAALGFFGLGLSTIAAATRPR